MKKLKKFKSKILMFIFALVLPLSATSVVYTVSEVKNANADNAASNYYSGYMKEVSLSNNNFNSGSSTYSISTSLSGWTGLMKDRKTTAGIINTGNTFQNYMTGTYRLSNNPLAKANDKNILMINSKTADSNDYSTARQGYKSNIVNLEANSFYSFQVSFKSDTNYNSYTTYVQHGTVDEDLNLTKSAFEEKKDGKIKSFGDHISFTYKSKTYYLHKELIDGANTTQNLTDVSFFYEDDEYVGLMYNDSPVYVAKSDVEKVEVNEETQYNIASGKKTYTCNIEYDTANSRYNVKAGTAYYTTKTEYSSLNDYVFGSIYLSGLKDSEGNAVKADYVQVTSKEWVTFYFFVATGNQAQSVTLDLWLGTNQTGHDSSGVVFFDDCHVYQYSENTFWKTYKSYFGKNYTQEITTSSGTTTQVFDCTNLVDLRNATNIEYPTHNFDFEEGIFNNDGSALKNWTKSGNGNAQIFDSRNPQAFKSATGGYDFVGSNLSCEVNINGEAISITPNNYVLGLWSKNGYVKVKSNAVSIDANQVCKIKATYKISEITSGNVYMFVEENDNILTSYNLTKDQYTLAEEASSTAVTTNGSSSFSNSYGTIEFYVKGGNLYNSSVNISLGLGKSNETATGCVVFDDITIEKTASSDFDNASNKLELDTYTSSLSIANGNFNKVTSEQDSTYPLAPQNWKIEKGTGFTFGGVVNTEAKEYAKYVEKYNQLKADNVDDLKNNYYWASYANPKNSYNSTSEPDNVMMLANITSAWQKLTSDNFTLSANSTNKLTFKYKTYNSNNGIIATLYNKDGVKLFESQKLNSNGQWNDYEIYLKSFSGASEVYLTIDYGTETDKAEGFAYFDNFDIESIDGSVFENKSSTSEGNGDAFAVVDMSDFYLKLPTNNITNDLTTSNTPAFTGAYGSGNSSIGGIIKSEGLGEIFKLDEENKNVFYITNHGVGSYTLQSNFNLDLEANKYYELSFKLKTNFNYTNADVSLDKDKTYNYGATFGLTGFDFMKQLVANEETYQTYTMYFNPSEAASAKLYLALVSDSIETTGSMAIYDIAFAEVEESVYTSAVEACAATDYDINKDKIMISKAEGKTDDDNDDDNNGDNTDTTPSTNGDLNWSILIASIITGAAIVIALIGWAMSKVKIKKIERKRKESYDRKESLHVDAIKIKARKQRDSDIEAVKTDIEKFQKELDKMEKEHKQKVLTLREKDKGTVSKETDREFKQFAKKRTVIAEKIDSLNKQIEEINSPEYLLNLERKIFAQDEMKQKELSKVSKKSKDEKDSSKK